MPKRKSKVSYNLLSREGKRLRRKQNPDRFDELLSTFCEQKGHFSSSEFDPSVPSTSQQESHPLLYDSVNDVEDEDLYSNVDSLSNSSAQLVVDRNLEGDLECISSSESSFGEGIIDSSNCGSDCSWPTDQPVEENIGIREIQHEVGSPSLCVQNFLREWAIDKNITISALTDLCTGLKTHHPSCFDSLPSDGRTLLKTPANLHIKDCPPGQYIHIGLKKQLELIVSNLKSSSLKYDSVDLLFNIDGIPLFNSSPGEFYPILFNVPSVKELQNKIFCVGLYYGVRKPDSLSDFMNEFISELKDVLINGIDTINVNLLGFCCDTPAKSYILGITSHVGYSSCTRCQIHGETMERRRVFLENNCPPRTHRDFIRRTDKIFQPRTTPLVEIPGIHFVQSFVLDYMHLICLGVLRTLLFLWYNGPLPHRMSKSQRDLISERLLSMRSFITSDFVRKPRELHLIKSWKATELRTFLLYLGPVVLKGVLPNDKYVNFLELHVSSTILLRSDMCRDTKYLELARQLLSDFIDSVKTLYGEMYISHNFHNLLHIVDDVYHFRSSIPNFTLHSVSAFPFENFLQRLKKRVRGHNRPLQQIGRRLGEIFCRERGSKIIKLNKSPQFVSRHNDGPLPAFCVSPQYKMLIFNHYNVSICPPNNCCKLKRGSIVIIENLAYSKELKKMVVIGKKFLKKENFYRNIGCHSSDLGIVKVDKLSSRKIFPIEEIKMKCLLLQLGGNKVVFPLLHCNHD